MGTMTPFAELGTGGKTGSRSGDEHTHELPWGTVELRERSASTGVVWTCQQMDDGRSSGELRDRWER